VGVDRVERLVTEHEQALETLFTERELAYCAGKRRRNEHLAARFAAKEAVLKALGTGLVRRMRWTDVEVVNDPSGRPEVRLTGEVAALAERRRLAALEISLAHSAGLAVAEALAVWDRGVAPCAST
jgi:holo-[acyl-carrier protein] synthase